jgi:quercetin dioxygenase-like cupin family protein
MAMLNKQHIDSANETRKFVAHGHADVVTLDDFTIGRTVFEPGWKWSNDVKPIAGTESCQVRHTGVFISGRMTVRANDGTEVSYGPGDVFLIEPGHDAWVEGVETCVAYDTGVAPYAKPANS